MTPAISTIIPVLNDAAALRTCLAALRKCAHSEHIQIIVADGGASTECRAFADEFGARYIACERGRARQMNHGAALALGKWLWFLHADCIPDAASLGAILDLDTHAFWGCFKHRIDAPGIALRVIEAADNLRARTVGLPYGDQGIFVQANVFRGLGGYACVPFLEDVLLARRLNEISAPRVLKPILKTDARRWLSRGVVRTTLTNWRIMFAYLALGKTPEELAAWYRK